MAVKFLKPDVVEKCNIFGYSFEIKKKIIPDDLKATRDEAQWIKKGGNMKPCKKMPAGKALGICIHNTEMIVTASGTNPAEQYSRATYNCHMSGARVHFYVWHDQIWQLLDIYEQGWHAGDSGKESKTLDKSGTINGNRDTIAIEIIGSDYESEKMGAILGAYLLKKLKLQHNNGLYYHKYFSGKNCPEYILPHWDNFVILLRTVMEGHEIFEKGARVQAFPLTVVSATRTTVTVSLNSKLYVFPIEYIRRLS